MTKHKEIVALTGLRGVAASLVAIYHFSILYSGPTLRWYVHEGYLSVDVFFILSGFVMATTYRHLFGKQIALNNYLRFLYLRIARIWPLYLLAVLAALVVYHSFREPLEVILANLFMMQGWGIAPSINVPLWSVSTEFVAYLVFPFLFLFASGSQRVRLPVLIGASLSLIWICAYINAHNPERNLFIHSLYGTRENGALDLYSPFSGLPVARCVAGFVLGVVVWHLSRQPRISALAGTNKFGITCTALIIVLAAVNANALIIYPLFPLFVLSLAQDKGLLAEFLRYPAVRYLGILSFAIYALQMPYFIGIGPWLFKLAHAVPPGFSTPVFYAAAAAGLLIVSMLAHYLIEKPSRMALRMHIRERAQPIAA